MVTRRILGTIFAMTLSLPAVARAEPPQIPMPDSYLALTVSLGGGAGMVIAAVPQEVNGKIAFCGAIWPDNAKGEAMSRRLPILRETIAKLRGKTVPAQLSVFPVYGSAAEAKTARCAVSNRPWKGPYASGEFNMRLRTSTLRE